MADTPEGHTPDPDPPLSRFGHIWPCPGFWGMVDHCVCAVLKRRPT